MHYLNHSFLTKQRLIDYVLNNKTKLMSIVPLPGREKAPSELQQFQKKLNQFFLECDLSTYPALQSVVSILLAVSSPIELDLAIIEIQAIATSDWEPNPQYFLEYNQRYGYFKNASVPHQRLFQELSILCRSMIVLIEKNNTSDDTMAYDYAYKLMALFVSQDDPAPELNESLYGSIHGLMSRVDTDKQCPFHQALLVTLESFPLASSVQDRAGWRDFIQKEGFKALRFWVDAEKIEQKISEVEQNDIRRAPRDLREAKLMAQRCRYQRFDEQTSFAQLCERYHVPEETFDKCLNYMKAGWPKKATDSLPDVVISGRDEAEGLFWLKLPVGDVRSLILGKIVDCCQSIGGHSECCVKDAVSLNNNGLYALLKSRKKSTIQPDLIVNGELNDIDYKIVAVSYAWRSHFGLCLDSLEGLQGEVTEAAFRVILSDFGHQIINNDPTIHYVTVGRGGKTPEHLFPEASIPERMREGAAYGDSALQYSIASRAVAWDENNDLAQQLIRLFKATDDYALAYLKARLMDRPDFQRQLVDLFLQGSAANANQAWLNGKCTLNLVILVLILLQREGLLTGDLVSCLRTKNGTEINYFITSMNVLISTGFIRGENGMANAVRWFGQTNAFSIGSAAELKILHEFGFLREGASQTLNYLNYLMLNNDKGGFAEAFSTIRQLHERGLLTSVMVSEYESMIWSHPNPRSLSDGMFALRDAGLLTDTHCKRLFQCSDARSVVKVLRLLNNVAKAGHDHSDLMQQVAYALSDEQRFQAIMAVMASLIARYWYPNEEILHDHLMIVIDLDVDSLGKLSLAIKNLTALNLRFIPELLQNVDVFMNAPDPTVAVEIFCNIKRLYNNTLTFAVTRAYFPMICGHIAPQTALEGIAVLNANQLLTDLHVRTILQYPDSLSAAKILSCLNAAGLGHDDLRRQHSQPMDAEWASVLLALHETRCLTAENYASLLTNSSNDSTKRFMFGFIKKHLEDKTLTKSLFESWLFSSNIYKHELKAIRPTNVRNPYHVTGLSIWKSSLMLDLCASAISGQVSEKKSRIFSLNA